MAQKRSRDPYIWVTTLAKLLTGENSCEWAGWFKATGRSRPPTSTPPPGCSSTPPWSTRSGESLEGTGYVVHTENQNLFRLRGTTATIAGKPDLIGEKTNEILISDAKTGNRSPSHRAQVQIYQYAFPKALTQFQGKQAQARGQVRYPDSYVGSPATSVTPDFVANLGSLIRRLADDVPARRVPSAQECRYCDITKADCPDRMEDSWTPEGSTDDF